MLKRSIAASTSVALLALLAACNSDGGLTPSEIISLHIEAPYDSGQQRTMVGTSLPNPLVARVRSGNQPVVGIPVTWSTESGDVAPLIAVTDRNGFSTAVWTLGTTPGPVEAHASITEHLERQVTFTAVALPAIRATLLAIADTVSATSPVTLQLKVVDSTTSAPRPGIAITWYGNGARNQYVGSGEFAPQYTTTDLDGIATTRWTPQTAGGHLVSALVTNFPGYWQIPDTLDVEAIPGPLAKIELYAKSTWERTVDPDVALSHNYSIPANFRGDTTGITAIAVDEFENPLANQHFVWTVTGNSFNLIPRSTTSDLAGQVTANAQLTGTLGATVIHAAIPDQMKEGVLTLQTTDTAYEVLGSWDVDWPTGHFVSRMNASMPAVDTIPVGATLTWHITADFLDQHTFVITPASGATPVTQMPGFNYFTTFLAAGTYQYEDTDTGWTGTVVVR